MASDCSGNEGAGGRRSEREWGFLTTQAMPIRAGQFNLANSKSDARTGNRYLELLSELKQERLGYRGLAHVSLFSGGGGMDLGLASAGFKGIYSEDVVESYCETIRTNLKTHTESLDIRAISRRHIFEVTGEREVTLVSGGPPCQAFSILGDRKSLSDPRGQLVFEFARIVKELKPLAFVFENVPGLLSVNKGADWTALLSYLQTKLKYHLAWEILDSVSYGVPQFRQRVILVGFQDHMAKSAFAFPEPEYACDQSYITSKTMPAIPSKLALENVDGLANQRVREHGPAVRARYTRIRPGDRDRIDHTDRIDPERPAGTVLVGSSAGGGRPHIHPYEPRVITVREGARLQSFPDWYVFKGTETSQYRQVGNAVPPLMARAVGLSIIKAL